MNRKQLILLIVVGAVVGGLGLLAYNKKNQNSDSSGSSMGAKVIKSFPLNDVERISIVQGQGHLNLNKKNDSWAVQERGDYPANFDTISDFLKKVWELKVTQSPQVGQSQLARLELTPPDKSPNSGTLVEFKDKGGKTLNSLLLGKKHMKEGHGDPAMGGAGWPDGRYIMVGSDLKTVAIVSEPFSNVESKPEEWLNKDFFKVENLRSIGITSVNASNNWKLVRDKEGAEWKLAEVKKDEQLDVGKAGGMNSALSAPTFTDVATNAAAETGLDQPTVAAKLETFDGFTYDVKVGKKVSEARDDYYCKVAISANIAKQRTPGKDEKPEDKTKLDKEYAEKAKKLEEKLKTEKAFEKWAYVVSKWTIDPLLKERKELLAEKKEEPKVADKSTATPPTIIKQ